MDVTFTYLKDTKNTYRFQEEVAEGAEPMVGQMYVSKAAFPEGQPNRIRVSIEKLS